MGLFLFLVGLLPTLIMAVALFIEILSVLYLVRFRKRTEPKSWPNVSILKPMAGLDDELELNLESHLKLEYAGEWEILLGVRSHEDAAYPIAKAFADAHPERVRLVMQEGEPGLNPKVNQLITLTRHAKHEIIALTDSNVRVVPGWLREHALFLQPPQVGLTSHGFVGVGEATFGSALDNLTLATFFPNLAAADVLLRLTQIVSKSLAIKREVLVAVGGWEAFKDLLAEDQRLGAALERKGYRTVVCPTAVHNIQKTQSFSYFWKRHTRRTMIRFKILPLAFIEPIINPFFTSLWLLATNGTLAWAWWVSLGAMVYSTIYAQLAAVFGRGYGFKLRWLLLMPVRDAVFFATWLSGAFLNEVEWRGNRLKVGKNTQLSKQR